MATPSEYTVFIIADDLTGAADSTAAFARQGFRTRVIADIRHWSLKDIAGYEVVSFNSGTRNVSEQESVSIVVSLARKLAKLKPRLILKKIDSTFRGHVLADTRAMLEEFGLERAVIVPAMPSEHRVVSKGAIFVHGAPLSGTTFARQPNPPPDNIPAAIRDALGEVIVFSGLSTRNLPESPPAGIYLPDVTLEEDLVHTARWIIAQEKSILPVCSTGLAHAFGRFLKPRMRASQAIPEKTKNPDGRMLIVTGSTLPDISSQIQLLISTRPDVILVEAANGNLIDVDIATIEQPIVILRMVQGSILISHSEASVNLGDTARLTMDALPVSQLITVGGETSDSVLHSLGISSVDITAQDILGLPVGEISHADRQLTFIAKPAGFSETSIFADMAEALHPRNKESSL